MAITGNETFITQAVETTDLPNSNILRAPPGSGLQLNHGANQVSVVFTGNVNALNTVSTNGICVLTNPGVMTTRAFDSSVTIDWDVNGSGNYEANVVAGTSNQLVNVLLNGSSLGGMWPTINLIPGSGGSINAVSNPFRGRYDVTISFSDASIADAHFLIATADGNIPNPVNLGLLSSGYLYGTVSSATSTISSVATIPINQGGTGQTTAGAAFTALSPSISYLGGTLCIGGNTNTPVYALSIDTLSSASIWMGRSNGSGPNPSQGGVYAVNDGDYPYFQNVNGVAQFILAVNGSVNPGTLNSLLVGNGTNYTPIAAGTANQVLSMNNDATSVFWADASALTNPMTTIGDIIVGDFEGTPTRLPAGATGKVLTILDGVPAWRDGLTNPMTTAGDIIYGGSSGAPTRLAATTNGFVLTLVSGNPAWTAPVNFTNPMTEASDLIVGGTSGAATRLGRGLSNQILSMDDEGVSIIWTEAGLTNPMSNVGDMIYGGNPVDGIAPATKLAAGTNNQILGINGGIPTWQRNPGRFLLAGDQATLSGGTVTITVSGLPSGCNVIAGYQDQNWLAGPGYLVSTVAGGGGSITINSYRAGGLLNTGDNSPIAWFAFSSFGTTS